MAPPWELDDVEWQVELAKIIDEPYFGSLPDRPEGCDGGKAFAEKLKGKSAEEAKKMILEELKKGNMPDFLREPAAITIVLPGDKSVTYYAMPDYLAVGSNDDYMLVPMSGDMAQEICREFQMVPPTAMMASDIHSLADHQFNAGDPDPSKNLTRPWASGNPPTDTPDKWVEHNTDIARLKQDVGASPGELVSGHKKDIVMSDRVEQSSAASASSGKKDPFAHDRLGLYGPGYSQNEAERNMEKQTGKDAPPMADAARHHPGYIDYSQGLRPVSAIVYVDSNDGRGPQPMHISEALSGSDPDVVKALSGEGSMKSPTIFADR